MVLLSLVVLVVAYQYGATPRFENPQPVLAMIALSAAYGLGLAVSRFQPRAAFLVNLTVSLGLGGIVMGRVLPGISYMVSHPFSKTLWLMNAQLFILLEQLRGGAEQLLSGALPRGVLVGPLFGLFAWHSISWLVWGVARRRQAWPGILACFGLLFADDLLAMREPSWSMWLTISALFLIANTSYAWKIDTWERTDVSYPELIPEAWGVGAAGIAAIVVLATGLSTPKWRSSIQDFLDSLRPPPSASPVPSPVATAASIRTPYAESFVPDMDTVGTAFASGNQTVFFVTTSDSPTWADNKGAMGPPTQQHYWRGAVFDRYTGTGWEMAPISEAVQQFDDHQEPPAGRYVLKQRFQILALVDDRLFAANQPVSATNGVRLRVVSSDGVTSLPRGRAAEYSVISWSSRVTWAQLSQDRADYPVAIREVYLQVPEETPQRVRDLATRITLGSRSAYEKASRIQEYLRSTYTYRPDVPKPPPDRDVVDYFLFDARAGFCSYYASAMAVMLRTQGVPARVVTGFATGEWDGVANRYRVPVSAAHSWVEVYFPSYGWIEFEPTATYTTFDFAAPDLLRSATSLGAIFLARATSSLRSALVAAGAAIGLACALGAVAIVLRRRQWRRPGHGRQLASLYWRMRRTLAPDRRAAQGCVTPGEFLSLHAGWLASLPHLDRAARQITSLYIQGAYSAHIPSPSEVLAAQRAWRSACWENMLLRWQRIWRSRGRNAAKDGADFDARVDDAFHFVRLRPTRVMFPVAPGTGRELSHDDVSGSQSCTCQPQQASRNYDLRPFR